MRRGLLALVVLGVGVLGATAGYAVSESRQPPPPPPAPGSAPALDTLAAHVRRLRGHFEHLRETTSDEENRLRRPRTPSYTEHLDRADVTPQRLLRGVGRDFDLAEHGAGLEFHP